MLKTSSGLCTLLSVSLLTGCFGSSSSSSDDGSINIASVPEIQAASLDTAEDAALYVAVVSRLFAAGDYEPGEETPPDVGPGGFSMSCSEGGSMTSTQVSMTDFESPFGAGDFDGLKTEFNECDNGIAGFTNGSRLVAFSDNAGGDDNAVLYITEGDLDAGAPLVGQGAGEGSEGLTERAECWDCDADTNVYHVSLYNELYVGDEQYAYRFQFGENRDSPFTSTETVLEYRPDDEDDYRYEYDMNGYVGINTSVCTLGLAHWESTETLEIVEFGLVDGAGDDFIETSIRRGEVSLNEGQATVVFNKGGATITVNGDTKEYDEDELWEAGMPCYQG